MAIGVHAGARASAAMELDHPLVVQPRPVEQEGRDRLQKYKYVCFLGKGGFAEVAKYIDTETGREIAIKSINKQNYRSGANLGAIKELQAMQEVHHENVLCLYDAFPYGDRVHLCLEYCATDLSQLIRDRSVQLSEANVKCLMQQMLRGTAAVHSCGFMHRDLKPDNMLITSHGIVKLADFGHAAPFPSADQPMFHRVVTLWYRAPELLLHCGWYGPAIDSWSIGCILAELVLRQPLFPAQPARPELEEREQLAQIYRLLGTPVDSASEAEAAAAALAACGLEVEAAVLQSQTASSAAASTAESSTAVSPAPRALMSNCPVWPGCSSLPGYAEFEPRTPQPWRLILPGVSEVARDLLSQLLVFDPLRRLTPAQALEHRWFKEQPLPCEPSMIPLPSTVAMR